MRTGSRIVGMVVMMVALNGCRLFASRPAGCPTDAQINQLLKGPVQRENAKAGAKPVSPTGVIWSKCIAITTGDQGQPHEGVYECLVGTRDDAASYEKQSPFRFTKNGSGWQVEALDPTNPKDPINRQYPVQPDGMVPRK